VLLEQYGDTVVPPKTGKRGRPRKSYKQWPDGAVYATVKKTYRQGKVESVKREITYGTPEDLAAALEASTCSEKINTSFVERHNGTDRCHNARKARKTYRFSKALLVHVAVGWWVLLCYNFHRVHRGLRQRLADGTYLHRTPAMVLGLEESPLSVADLMSIQVVGFTPPTRPTLGDFARRVPTARAP